MVMTEAWRNQRVHLTNFIHVKYNLWTLNSGHWLGLEYYDVHFHVLGVVAGMVPFQAVEQICFLYCLALTSGIFLTYLCVVSFEICQPLKSKCGGPFFVEFPQLWRIVRALIFPVFQRTSTFTSTFSAGSFDNAVLFGMYIGEPKNCRLTGYCYVYFCCLIGCLIYPYQVKTAQTLSYFWQMLSGSWIKIVLWPSCFFQFL